VKFRKPIRENFPWNLACFQKALVKFLILIPWIRLFTSAGVLKDMTLASMTDFTVLGLVLIDQLIFIFSDILNSLSEGSSYELCEWWVECHMKLFENIIFTWCLTCMHFWFKTIFFVRFLSLRNICWMSLPHLGLDCHGHSLAISDLDTMDGFEVREKLEVCI